MALDKFPYPKAPDEELDYTRDFAALVGDEDVSHPTVTCSSDDVTISNVQLVGKAVTCLVDGGEAGKDYALRFGVRFDSGARSFFRTVVLRVRDR